MNTYQILMILCGLVIFSYLFDLLASRTRMPSVLLLLFLGIGIKQVILYFGIPMFDIQFILPPLGALGLILIVFEGALELKYDKDKNSLIWRSFFSALVIMVFTTLLIAFILMQLTGASMHMCFINAIPFSIISSSIAIPSSAGLQKATREFIIYESSFSDILGIILFNFGLSNEKLSFSSFTGLGAEILLIVVIAILSCLLLLYLLGRISHHIKFFLIISILILVYSIGELYQLSSLVIVLAFGLFLNNADEIRIPRFKRFFIYPQLERDLTQLLQLSAESAFIIRTFFFVTFGFAIDINQLEDLTVIEYGVYVVAAIYLIRFAYLKYVAKTTLFPEALVTPRGLITILLFYHLPVNLRIKGVETGLLFLVILSTCLIMSFGLLSSKKHKNTG